MAPMDHALIAIEDNFIKSGKSLVGALAASTVNQHMPARPGYGSQGKKILVYANYFKVSAPKELTLTRYNVEVTPEVKGKKLSRVFQLLLALPEFVDCATEWKSFIISKTTLSIPNDYTVQIPYLAEGHDEPQARAVTYTVRVVTPLTYSVSDLIHFLSSGNASSAFGPKAETIQVLNAVFGHHPQSHDGTVSAGQNRHFSIDRTPANRHNVHILGGGLESLRGFYQSVRTASAGILLNVNVTHGVFLQPDTLDRLYNQLGSGNKLTLQKKLKLVRVNVTHLPVIKHKTTGKNIPRIKTIFGLAHQQDGRSDPHPPQVTSFGAGPRDVKFWLSDSPPPATDAKPAAKGKGAKPAPKASGPALPSNVYMSVFDYFKRKYPNIQLNPNLPVVNVGNRENPNYLPAEVCLVVAGQTIKRRLSPDQTQQMITFACRKPWENGNSIVSDGKAVLGLGRGSNPTLARFGLAVGDSLITVAARVLPAPQIKYKNLQNKETSLMPRGGTWNMANVRFHTASNIGPWTYIWFKSTRGRDYFGDEDLRRTVMSFKDFLNKAGINANGFIQAPPPAVIDLVDGQEGANDAKITGIFRKMFTAAAPIVRPRFVLCILPFNDVAIYNSIKTVADTKAGIHTVCVVAQKFMKEMRQDQYFGNISLKFNLKAGGTNQTLDVPKYGIINEGKTMVIGIDVTHPSPGSKDTAPSVAGVVASVDKFLGQWPCDFAIQESRKEMVTALEGMILSRLRLWTARNKLPPENLLIYRDGVSEGQYDQLLDQELPLIRNACRQFYPATATSKGFPKISIIVCGKRHHTRFYPTDTANADRSSNCEPGTIVDRSVTEAGNWDFFVQSHACLQGTARPGHYYVILDEIFRGRPVKPPHVNAADALEELTHNMCHLFGRATKAVSLCPPAYYADLLCTRLRCYLAEQFDPNDTSATPSVASGATPTTTFDIKIPDNLRDSMFYI